MIETSVLPCGIRLVTETMADVRSVAVAYWVGTGSRDEPGELAGASHFLEHLLFKGTERRSAAAIAEELDEVGGDCNAFTTKEYTTFYVRLLSEHLPLGLDILSDIMWEPALRPDDIEAERTVILDEILMHADEPADLAAERWQAALFPGHALGRDTLGHGGVGAAHRPARTSAPSSTQHYRPGQHGRLGGRRLHPRRGGRPTSSAASPAPRAARRPTRTAPGPDTVAARRGPPPHRAGPPRLRHALGLALRRAALGPGRAQPRPRAAACRAGSSRRSARSAGWPTRSGPSGRPTRTPARWPWWSGTAPEHVDEVLRIVDGELELLAADGVTDRELAVAKGNLRAEMLLSGEDSGARMSRIGASLLLHGEVLDGRRGAGPHRRGRAGRRARRGRRAGAVAAHA